MRGRHLATIPQWLAANPASVLTFLAPPTALFTLALPCEALPAPFLPVAAAPFLPATAPLPLFLPAVAVPFLPVIDGLLCRAADACSFLAAPWRNTRHKGNVRNVNKFVTDAGRGYPKERPSSPLKGPIGARPTTVSTTVANNRSISANLTFAPSAAGGSGAAGTAASRSAGSRRAAATAGSSPGLGRGRPGLGRWGAAPLLEHLCYELERGGLLLATTGPPTGIPATLGALKERAERRERRLLSTLLPLLHICGRCQARTAAAGKHGAKISRE